MADWLNGAGLVCNIAGVVAIYFFGVPRYRPLEDSRKSYLLLEQPDVETGMRAKSASLLGHLGLMLLGIGFGLQFTALFV